MSTVIGIDLGGTKVAAAVLRDRVLGGTVQHPTELGSSEALINQVVALVEEIRDDQLEAVGIGVPSVVDFETGSVISSVNIPLKNVPLRSVLGDRLGVPVFVDNDATVAALAEAHDEALNLVSRNLVMLTIGTGIGGGIVLEGRIFRGATGGAGEFGHQMIGLHLEDPVPAPVSFPQPASLEYMASGHGLDRLAVACAQHHPDSPLGHLAAGGRAVLGADAVRAALDGDSEAGRTVEIWSQRVGIGVANAINTFDPDEVVIGGGAARAGNLLLLPAEKVARGYVVPGLGRKTTIRLARFGVGAGVLGAALLAAHEREKSP